MIYVLCKENKGYLIKTIATGNSITYTKVVSVIKILRYALMIKSLCNFYSCR